ncbi:hypothetical protein DPMN_055494 [Dreissena polymorpha]|uniref:Uncharacterized protein n=1 Tax=Dreissena polymorpha TaxID=45954 RepID=A0A9D4HU51_DREPO|nr:hypothetical protein DPMN_055494 [Dreissena polymorpha]
MRRYKATCPHDDRETLSALIWQFPDRAIQALDEKGIVDAHRVYPRKLSAFTVRHPWYLSYGDTNYLNPALSESFFENLNPVSNEIAGWARYEIF